jgi:putative NADPH-quinone reductase
MRLLVIHAHPVPESFSAALCKVAVDSARAQGHEVQLIDLYAEGFNPVMSAEEHRAYQDDGPPPTDVAPHIAALQWAEGLIFVYPTWWYAQPAMLKGWMDRVWRPGVTFTVPSPGAPMRPADRGDHHLWRAVVALDLRNGRAGAADDLAGFAPVHRQADENLLAGPA